MSGDTLLIQLRPYQVEALEAVERSSARGVRRALVVHPTGAGKTVTFSHLIAARQGRSLVLVHRDELAHQTVAKMSMIAPEMSVGIVKAERDEYDADVVVASVQTAYRDNRLAKLRGFTTVVVDEAHHASAPSWKRVLEHLGSFTDDGPLTVGFTATPEREGSKLGVWQDVAHYKSIREMIYAGYLSPVTGQTVETEADFSQVRVSRGDFSESDLGEELTRSGAIDEIASAYMTYATDRKGVAFTPTVVTAQALAEALAAVGIPAEAVWGAQPLDERRAVLARLKSGQTQVVTNCAVLTEGFDEPSIDCIVVARPTRAHGLYIQMVGRGMRKHPGKSGLMILDVTGASERHDLVALVDLGLDTPTSQRQQDMEAEGRSSGRCTLCHRPLSEKSVAQGLTRHPNCRASRTSKVDVFAASKLRWLPVDEGFVLGADKEVVVMVPVAEGLWQLSRYAGGQVEVLYESIPVDWASGIGEDRAKAFGKLARRDAGWLRMPPTPAQLSRLVREGLPEGRLGAVSTRGQAADLVTRIQGRRAIKRLSRGRQ